MDGRRDAEEPAELETAASTADSGIADAMPPGLRMDFSQFPIAACVAPSHSSQRPGPLVDFSASP
eukprot:352308-Chlamydomonas_euryale.AAC.4